MTIQESKIAARLTLPRAEIIVAGGLVLEGAMRALGIKSLSTSGDCEREDYRSLARLGGTIASANA